MPHIHIFSDSCLFVSYLLIVWQCIALKMTKEVVIEMVTDHVLLYNTKSNVL